MHREHHGWHGTGNQIRWVQRINRCNDTIQKEKVWLNILVPYTLDQKWEEKNKQQRAMQALVTQKTRQTRITYSWCRRWHEHVTNFSQIHSEIENIGNSYEMSFKNYVVPGRKLKNAGSLNIWHSHDERFIFFMGEF